MMAKQMRLSFQKKKKKPREFSKKYSFGWTDYVFRMSYGRRCYYCCDPQHEPFSCCWWWCGGVKSSKAHLSCFGVVDRKEKGRREFTEWWDMKRTSNVRCHGDQDEVESA